MRVLGISGSLRRASHNRKLLRAAAAELPPEATLVVWDELASIPAYDEDLDVSPAPAPVVGLREALAGADAVLISTPEYNSSVPGALKNALDWASRPFPDNVLRGKPVAVVGTSTGLFGAVWAQAETRKVLGAIGAQVIEEELPVGQAESAFDEHGALVDSEQAEQLRSVVGALLGAAGAPSQITGARSSSSASEQAA